MFQQGLKGVGENLVRAIPDEHLVGRNAVMGRDRLAQDGCARIGVQAQALGGGRDCSQCVRRRRVRILVGVELDDAVLLRLLARHVGRQVVNDRTPETAHDV